MTLLVTSPPAAEPVSLEEAKAHLRVTYADEDALILRLLAAARERVEAELGLALTLTGFREVLDAWPPDAWPPDAWPPDAWTPDAWPVGGDGCLSLQRGPLAAVSGLAVAAASGAFVPLDPAVYAADVGSRPGRVRPVISWGLGRQGLGRPAPGVAFAGVRIDYVAGFGPTPADVPEPLRQAVLALAAHAFEHRADADPPLPAAESWLRPWRRVRL